MPESLDTGQPVKGIHVHSPGLECQQVKKRWDQWGSQWSQFTSMLWHGHLAYPTDTDHPSATVIPQDSIKQKKKSMEQTANPVSSEMVLQLWRIPNTNSVILSSDHMRAIKRQTVDSLLVRRRLQMATSIAGSVETPLWPHRPHR